MGDPLLNILIPRQTLDVSLDQSMIRRFGKSTRLMIDSGAYIDFSNDRDPMNVFDWIAWARQMKRDVIDYVAEFSGLVSLDVIGDPRATRRNYEIIRDAGIDVLPVITRGAPDEDIERYLDTSDYICLGGVARGGARERSIVKSLEARLPDTHRRHWLGFGPLNFVTRYRPYSYDSTGIASGNMYSNITLLMSDGRLRIIRDKVLTADDRRLIRKAGFNPNLAARPPAYKRDYQSIHSCLSVASYIDYGRMIEDRLGSRYHFACHARPEFTVQVYQRHLGGICLPVLSAFEMYTLFGFDRVGAGAITEDELPEGRDAHDHWRDR